MNDRATVDEAYDLAAVKADITRLSQQVGEAVGTLSSIAKGQARRGLKQARADVEALVTQASDGANVAADAAQGAAATLEDTLSDAILDRPLASISLALGLGFLIGVTWRR